MNLAKQSFIAFSIVLFVYSSSPVRAGLVPVRAAVVRSQGTTSLDSTIWRELNADWSNFGEVPVEIDYTSLAGNNLTLQDIETTNPDVLILSAPGSFYNYLDTEIDAIIDYVQAGHGIIFTYINFSGNKSRLAPLVGLSHSPNLATNTFSNGIEFELLAPDHPLFAGLNGSYSTGVPFMAWPQYPNVNQWPIGTGQVVAESWSYSGSSLRHGSIVANENQSYRGLYFSHYIEDKQAGSYDQDMQVFYNGLLWTAVPEPSTLLLLGLGAVILRRKR
jgi:hypothetical protein